MWDKSQCCDWHICGYIWRCCCASWWVLVSKLASSLSMSNFAEFQIPAPISRYASFLFSFIGRGALSFAVYIFAGSILLENHVINIIFGTIIGIVGICYVILEFIPPIDAPVNMKEVETV
ncbi:hypothetical protein Golomagni_04402 [Golovinomyces magnicellulatus]|nr:hypothetical protein Golomagni_04402 [Golovinomyces magnicellulatus]